MKPLYLVLALPAGTELQNRLPSSLYFRGNKALSYFFCYLVIKHENKSDYVITFILQSDKLSKNLQTSTYFSQAEVQLLYGHYRPHLAS